LYVFAPVAVNTVGAPAQVGLIDAVAFTVIAGLITIVVVAVEGHPAAVTVTV
jgi:hypothetical protein